MRVAYVCADPGIPLRGTKGASVHLRSLVEALLRRGNELLVICARTDGSNPPPTGAHIAQLPPEGQAMWLASKFADARVEAVLERYSLPSGSALDAARKLGLPFTLEVNAPLVYEAARFRGLTDSEMWRARELKLLRAADRVIVVSQALRDHVLAAGVRPDAVRVIPNGVQVNLFRHGGGVAIRKKLGLDDALVIGFVGSLKPWHGVGLLLEALVDLPSSHRLLIVGEGPQEPALKDRASLLGLGTRALFAGAVPHIEVPAHMDAMDIGVAPFEPMKAFYFSPLKVAEYLAAGLPVVASRQGDLPQLVGDAGLLYEPGSREGLTAALRRLGGDAALRMRLGRTAIARAAKMDWDGVAALVEKTLAVAVRQRTPA